VFAGLTMMMAPWHGKQTLYAHKPILKLFSLKKVVPPEMRRKFAPSVR